MNDLFDDALPAARAGGAPAGTAPLAERMRPRRFDQVIGQSHLLGPGKPLRIAFESRHPHSMILWGPPGVGKTTIARLMADAFGLEFIAISAVLGGVKDIRDAIEQAQATLARSGRATVVFVDEVHRFNKAQQDAFLPHVESGLFVFVGATTENPSFEVIGALLSRASVYVLEPLTGEELGELLERARRDFLNEVTIEAGAREMLIELADGDARRLLNALEVAADAAKGTKGAEGSAAAIDVPFLRATLPATLRRFDKGGENFYDQISALHKSVRGSDPDAALYWMVRMLDGGADPLYIARRAIRMATEDVGLADPRALSLALDAAQTYERLGSPEGELALAQAIVYLAAAPKSNAVYVAFGQVRDFVARDGTRPVPLHLRNAPTRLMKELGYGRGYRYAHDEADAFAAGETYLPPGVQHEPWYRPTDRGLEAKIAQRLDELRRQNETNRKGDA
ncbi:MAG: replication-associated recombination protein A [Burkholderiaceae bacterium]|nr:replication-associated recombination protein A [Burkholderiaceae bacterium]